MIIKFKTRSLKHKEIIDITDEVQKYLKKQPIKEGVLHLLVTHTSCALTTADLDPGTDLDMLEAFEKMIPKINFRHEHDPSHTPDHILSSLIGTSLSLPFEQGKLILGIWQRVVLVEFNGPKERTIIVYL